MDNEISLLLKHNDPNMTSVIIDYKGIGDINSEDIYLDDNTYLKEIEIEDLWHTTNNSFNTELCNFLSAIARSKSIEKLFIEDFDGVDGIYPIEVIQSLSPLFNANLCDINFGFSITEREAELLSSILSNSINKSLTEITITLVRVSDETAANIYTALADYKLVKLHARCGVGGRKAYTAISKLLQSPTTLKKLILCDAESYDEPMEILSNALINNRTLVFESLSGDGTTKYGWLLYAKALQNPQSALHEIDLSGFCFKDNDDTAQVLANALACIPSLKTIEVNSLSPFIDIIQCENTSLENFYMDNDDRSVDLGSALGSALANNTTLKSLSLHHGRFSTEASEVLGRSLYSSSTLKYLDLSFAESIDWGSIFPALHSQVSFLEVLLLEEAGVEDDDLSLMANAFVTNRSLKKKNQSRKE